MSQDNTAPTERAVLRLKRKEARRLRAGHPWVFSNEVDTKATPLRHYEPGQEILIQADDGKFLGMGYVNPNSLICARLLSRDPSQLLDRSLIIHRLNIALSLRQRLFRQPYYRLVFGESDALPGLIVDRYGDVLVAQITTAGMERIKPQILEALDKVLRPQAIVWRNDSAIRELEGLAQYSELAMGELPTSVTLVENEARYQIDVLAGQKTGWFYDQRHNRLRLRDYVAGQRVLDLFSYGGGWGINAALAGAKEVLCVDASQTAIDSCLQNAELNRLGSILTATKADIFDYLKHLRAERQHYDVIVLDPPALIKRKKDIKAGTQAYQRLNQAAMQLLSKDGILVSCSCSYHLAQQELRLLLGHSARHIDRFMQFLETGQQSPDHPVHPAVPEMAYLKAYFCRLLPNN